VIQFELISWHFPVGTKKNYENPKGNTFPERELNPITFKYESEM
jgi:hypothetical protein